jgi:hypothetical protein
MTVSSGRQEFAPESTGGVIESAGAQELNRLPDGYTSLTAGRD